MAKVTEQRRALRAAVEPLLRDGETVTVAAGPADYETGGLTKTNFNVTVTVGVAGDEASAERLDELLSGAVKTALEECDLGARVTRSSGYQTVTAPEAALLGATWTAQTLE